MTRMDLPQKHTQRNISRQPETFTTFPCKGRYRLHRNSRHLFSDIKTIRPSVARYRSMLLWSNPPHQVHDMFIQDVTGASVDAPDALTYPACPQCHKKVQGMTCASHGQIPADQIENRYLLKISVADRSASGIVVTVEVWRPSLFGPRHWNRLSFFV